MRTARIALFWIVLLLVMVPIFAVAFVATISGQIREVGSDAMFALERWAYGTDE